MERLIESVRKYPCLWKLDSEEYKCTDLKAEAWKNVKKECDLFDVKEAQTLWKKLRDGHRQVIVKKKTVTGQAATSNHSWKYEKQMEFLLPTMQNRPRFSNMSQAQFGSNEDQLLQNEESNESLVELPYGNLNPPKKKANLVLILEKEQRRREQRSTERDTLRKQILLSSSTAAQPETALEKFFNSMQLTTQALPEGLQLRVQRQIFNIVMEAKEEHLATQGRNSAATSATTIDNIRGNSSPQFPIYAGSSHSASSLSNYECYNPRSSLPQSSPQFFDQYASPPQPEPQISNQYASISQSSPQVSDQSASPPQPKPQFSNQYASIPQSSPQVSDQYASPPQPKPQFSNQYASIPQSSPQFSNQYESPPQPKPQFSNQYASIPQSSPQFSNQYESPPQLNPQFSNQYASIPQTRSQTNQVIHITHPNSVQTNPASDSEQHQHTDTSMSQSTNIRKYLQESFFD